MICSLKLRNVILTELMCLAEENIEERHSSAGWKVYLLAIEVGARGYAACSLRSCFSILAFIQRTVRNKMKNASDTALRCSFWIWLKKWIITIQREGRKV